MPYNPSTPAFYYSYRPYLQPTPSLGTGARIAGSAALGTRPQIGGINRIYNYFKTRGRSIEFMNQLVIDTYGFRKS